MNYLFCLVLIGIIAFVATSMTIPQIVKVARKKNLFDTPNARKVSLVITPTLGGIAIFVGLLLSLSIGTSKFGYSNLSCIFASLFVIFIVGIVDDLISIKPKSKLLIMILSLVMLVFLANIRFAHMYNLFGVDQLNMPLSILLSLFIGVVLINSMNLIDGIDGLSSSIAFQVSTILGAWFFLNEAYEYAFIAIALASSSIAFFFYNVFGHRNKLFMGDTGSLLIGAVLFILAAKFNEINAVASGEFVVKSAPGVLIGIMIYPLFDVARVFTLRIFMKRSPFSPDKNHIHHRLLTLGLSHVACTSIIFFTNLTFAISALWLQEYLTTFQLILTLVIASVVLSTLFEIYLLKRKKIKPNDKTQQIFLPRRLTQKYA